MSTTENMMKLKTTTPMICVAVEDLPVVRSPKRSDVRRARQATQRADKHREPEPRLPQHPLRPAFLLLRLRRRGACLVPPSQAPRGDQSANGEQRHPEHEVDRGTDGVLSPEAPRVEDQDVEDAERHAETHRSEQEADEHHARPPVLHQENVDPEELRVQCRHEGKPEERGAHGDSRSSTHKSFPDRSFAREVTPIG
jgi:hypothetical protein